ncbi:MAG: phage baseplate assembly protein V [Chitinophagales bacterium]|nr:phage baseplate assembly protein V [Chitinophagales bacterium]
MMEESLVEQLIDNVRNKYYGKYRGTVVNNTDTTQKGRIQVNVPAVLGDLMVWAMPCLPFAGMNVGMFAVPEVGSGVWVEFEGGDPSYPIYTGGWWGDGDVPMTEKGAPATPQVKIIRSKSGLLISFDDAAQVLSVSDQAGTNLLTIEVMKGTIKIQGAVKAVVEAPQIDLVENSTEPVVFGNQLLSYLNQLTTMFNTHMHPGETAIGVLPVTPAPPTPQMPPPTPALISTRVKTG